MASVSENVDDLAAELKVFSDAAGQQDIASMTLSAERASKIIGTIESLNAPEALAEVHKAYVAGAQQLMGALDAYIALYTELENGSIDAAGAQMRLKAIQADYDKGISQLKEADSLAVDAAGMTPSDASGKDSSGTSADGADSAGDNSKAA